MKIRTLVGLLTVTIVASAQAPKTLDADVDKVEVKDGKARAGMLLIATRDVVPGDKGYFVKDGQKVDKSDFEIDRVDDRLAYANTVFPSKEELRAKTSKARIVVTHACPRGGARPDTFANDDVRKGQAPAPGFAFANVTAAERVHKTEIAITIDKGSDDGVLPASSAYGIDANTGKPFGAGYVSVSWVTAKTAGLVVTAGDADELMKKTKRVGFERLICK